MHKNDPVGLALLRVGGRHPQAQVQAEAAQYQPGQGKPRNHPAGQRVKALRSGVLEPIDAANRHGGSCRGLNLP